MPKDEHTGPDSPTTSPLGRWRSPLRGLWLTSVLSVVLLGGMVIVFATGLFSYAAYNPQLGTLNDFTPDKGILGFYLFNWPTEPSWLYRLNEGVHVTLGIILIPIVLAKLWSVIPKLFVWPPVKSASQAVERFTLLLLVGGVLFEIITGLLDIQYWYVFPFSFYGAHFYGAWVTIGAFVAHVVLKLPRMVAGLRSRSLSHELRTPLARTEPGPFTDDELVAEEPDSPSISRRGLLGLVGGGSAALFFLTAGQTIGGPFRSLSVLAPRGRNYGSGPNDFAINKTAAYRRIKASDTGSSWRLTVASQAGEAAATLSRDDLLAMELHTYQLPIACVEGWSTVQTWTGVRLRDLARVAGMPEPELLLVESLQTGGEFGSALLSREQVLDPKSLLALKVNGADLSDDHGFPARVIVPAAPGVHNTKWVNRLTFQKEPA